MSGDLKPGDRVRVTARYRGEIYQAGDPGTVLRPLGADPGGVLYYLVTPDKVDRARTIAIFTEEEIEPDPAARLVPRSSKRLKNGDRVRLTVWCRTAGYFPGDQGVVAGLFHNRGPRRAFYAVRMDKDGPAAPPVAFHAEEIEPDV
jgi:hypothetical protein